MATTSDTGTTRPASGHVDWEFAKATGRRLVPAGPTVSAPREAADVVAELRAAAAAGRGAGRRDRPAARPAATRPVLVVDRAGWIDANVDSLRAMLDPVIDTMLDKRPTQPRRAGPSPGHRRQGHRRRGRRAAGLPGRARSSASTTSRPSGTPRLLLVAPNIVHVERELGVDPHDFRLWVCLHEETHRVQFTAVPWLRDHLVERDASSRRRPGARPRAELGAELQRAGRASCPRRSRSGGGGLIDLFATPEQRAQLGRVTAVMSLLEGHADVVMDDVGPQVIPTSAQIRAQVQRSAARARRRRPAAAPAARPRGQDAPVPRRRRLRPRGRRRGRHGRVQRASGPPRRPCRCPAEIERPDGLGRAASTADAPA